MALKIKVCNVAKGKTPPTHPEGESWKGNIHIVSVFLATVCINPSLQSSMLHQGKYRAEQTNVSAAVQAHNRCSNPDVECPRLVPSANNPSVQCTTLYRWENDLCMTLHLAVMRKTDDWQLFEVSVYRHCWVRYLLSVISGLVTDWTRPCLTTCSHLGVMMSKELFIKAHPDTQIQSGIKRAVSGGGRPVRNETCVTPQWHMEHTHSVFHLVGVSGTLDLLIVWNVSTVSRLDCLAGQGIEKRMSDSVQTKQISQRDPMQSQQSSATAAGVCSMKGEAVPGPFDLFDLLA